MSGWLLTLAPIFTFLIIGVLYSQLVGDKNFIDSINLDNKSVNFIGSLDYLHYHNICDDKLRKWGADINSIDSYVNIDDGIYMACKSVIKNN